jgi:ribosomal-protein-alanine N-acetyltransferase
MFPIVIETDKLKMKKPEENPIFLNKLHSMFSRESGKKITKHTPYTPHVNIKETKKTVNSWIKNFEKGNSLNYVLLDKKTESLIGMCKLSTHWKQGYSSINCCLKPEYWSDGYSKERDLALIELSFEDLSLNRVEVALDTENKKYESCVSSYMDRILGGKMIEYNEYTEDKKRRTLIYGVSNIDYEESGGLDVINEKYYSETK